MDTIPPGRNSEERLRSKSPGVALRPSKEKNLQPRILYQDAPGALKRRTLKARSPAALEFNPGVQ